MQKSYFITGANRGIGLAFCDYLLSKGNKIWAASRPSSNRNQLNKLKNQYNEKITLLDLDITKDCDIAAIKTQLLNTQIDILLNIAGLFDLADEEFTSKFEPWEYMLRVNTIAPTLLAETLFSNLQQSPQALVVNLSSDMGSIELNTNAIYTPYRVSKAALNAMTKSYAIKWQTHNIAVIAMHPGWVRTDMGGPNGLLSAQESVAMMHDVISRINIDDTGKFLSYEKEVMPGSVASFS